MPVYKGTTRPTTLCMRGDGKRNTCRKPLSDHVGESRACPDGSGRTFRKHTTVSRASTSFSSEEIEVLGTVLSKLTTRGADLSVYARSEAFASLARKVQTMSRTAKESA